MTATAPPLPRQLVPSQCGHCGRAIVQPATGRTRLFCDGKCRVNQWRAERSGFSHRCDRCSTVSLPDRSESSNERRGVRAGNETAAHRLRMTSFHLTSAKRGLPAGHIAVCECGFASRRHSSASAAAAEVVDHARAKSKVRR